ncbi:MAG: hypothetical protein JSW60_06685 [Thermoplasmatales archaeon]|nr:MAG: hypothetical protein JSW60_06685 [Thermoplasmatales archaeon]
MVRKRGKKSRKRLLSLGINGDFPEGKKKKPKKRVRKPKMPARIKKNHRRV